ncbi:MAG: diguanylate cyclase [Pseudomonadota bacterium]
MNSPSPGDSIRLRRYVTSLFACYTLLVAGSTAWNVKEVGDKTLEMARIQGRTAIQKDLIYRQWNTDQDKVYVPVSERRRPNRYLQVPGRDTVTESGLALTLVNPSFMTRLALEIQNRRMGLKGHMTSLKPLRPENAPDGWETKALEALERGEGEVSSVESRADEAVMRLMLPLITEESCMECHFSQGYKVGDIRGGIGVKVPLDPLWNTARGAVVALCIGHLCIWLLGSAVLYVGAAGLNSNILQLRASEKERERLIDDLRTTQNHLRFQATHDQLTGLLNRAAVLEVLGTELIRSRRGAAPLGVIMADIDHFKCINDEHGHQAGDDVLREIGRRIGSEMRPYDSAGRYGGEEFILVIPGCDGGESVGVAERLRKSLSDTPMVAAGRVLGVTVSMGVASTRRGEETDVDSLVRVADEALYRAKDGGRNRVERADA